MNENTLDAARENIEENEEAYKKMGEVDSTSDEKRKRRAWFWFRAGFRASGEGFNGTYPFRRDWEKITNHDTVKQKFKDVWEDVHYPGDNDNDS